MNKLLSRLVGVVVTVMLLSLISTAHAVEGNKKRGRVYFKMVCTVCHMTQAVKAIPPNSMTMAQWAAYMKADKHDKTGESNPSVKYYVSKEYRESVKDSNKAAAKFLSLSAEQLFADVRDFTVSGAKDSDTPASCE